MRRYTSVQWLSFNPVLEPEEVGLELDTSRFKVGDGATRWASLPYGVPGGGGTSVQDSRINIYAGSPAGDSPITGFSVDVLEGTDLALNGDTGTVDISTNGLYYVQWNAADQHVSLALGGGCVEGDGQVDAAAVGFVMFRCAAPGTVRFTKQTTLPTSLGVDIFRVA
jgi:hypothetical protein